ncbi:MAG: outer membrane protein assembly factor BamB family protein [Pirellulales bacterium]
MSPIKSRLCSLVVLVALAYASQASAQVTSHGIISSNTLDRMGLEREWVAHLPISSIYSEITHLTQSINLDEKMTVFEIDHQGRKVTFSSKNLDTYGKPLGKEGAKKQAEQFVARIGGAEKAPEIVEHVIPDITLFVQTNSGMIHSFDGQTGRTIWSQTPGNVRYPSQKPAANQNYVAVVNGTSLYLLHRKNGELVWKRDLKGVPGAGPVFGEKSIYLPLLSGKVLIYDIEDPLTPIGNFQSFGRVYNTPTATTKTVSWVTDRGFMYAGNSFDTKLRYRVEATGEILASTTYLAPHYLYFTTVDGYVYCIYERDGSTEWRFSCGQSITSAPFPHKDAVYITLQNGGLYRLGAQDGVVDWFSSRIRKILSVTDERVYCTDAMRRLWVLDTKTGSPISSMDIQGIDFLYTNLETDRIILGKKTGTLQALRASDLKYPQINVDLPSNKEDEDVDLNDPNNQPKPEQPMGNAPANPFGAGGGGGGNTNPFGNGGGNTPDPFGNSGGGANPFGPPAGGSTPDPFGGGNDPAPNPFGN